MAIYNCKICNKTYKMNPAKKSKYCSRHCTGISKTGKKHTIEHCRKISESITGKKNPFYGKKHSLETRKKMSKAKFGKYFGINNPNWKNERKIHHGYACIRVQNHPFARQNKYVAEHRLVAESIIRRYLKPTEQIHHMDENKLNNSPTNLYIFISNKAHRIYHGLIKEHPEFKITKSNLIFQ